MNWKSFKEYIPYLSGLIILLGLIRQMVYYHHFDIPIQNYIGVSELFLAWMDESFFLIFLILVISGFTSSIYEEFKFETFNSRRKFLLYTVITSWILLMIFLFFIDNNSLGAFYLAGIFFPISFGPAYFLADNFCQDALGFSLKLSSFKIIYIPVFTVILLIFLTKGSIQRVSEDGKYSGTKIYTNDSTYVSDSTHFFIGKTENFYFIYNTGKKSTLVIPEREVSKFELHGYLPDNQNEHH